MSQPEDPLFDYILSLGEKKVKMIGSRNLSILGGLYGNDLQRYKQIIEKIIEMKENGMNVKLNITSKSCDLKQ